MLLASAPAPAQEFMKSAKEQADLYAQERRKLEQLFSQQSKSAGSVGVQAQEQAKKQQDSTQAIAKLGAPTPEDVQQKPDAAAKEQEKARKEAEERDRQAKEQAKRDAEKAKKEAEEKDRQAKAKAKRDAEAADKAAKEKAESDAKATQAAASKAAEKAKPTPEPETVSGQAVLSEAASDIADVAKQGGGAGSAKDKVEADKAAAAEFMKNLKK